MKVEIAPNAFDGLLRKTPVRDFLRNVKYGLQNLWYWLPIIWKDRDWDDAYLYEIMLHKLKSMHEVMKDAQFVKADREAHNIWIACVLLQRLIDSFPEENAYERHIKVYGDPELRFVPLENGNYKMDVLYEGDQKAAEDARLWWCVRHATKQEKFYVDYLFDHIAKHVQKWWT